MDIDVDDMQGESGRAAYHSEPFSTEPGASQLLALRPTIAGQPSLCRFLP